MTAYIEHDELIMSCCAFIAGIRFNNKTIPYRRTLESLNAHCGKVQSSIILVEDLVTSRPHYLNFQQVLAATRTSLLHLIQDLRNIQDDDDEAGISILVDKKGSREDYIHLI